MNEFNKPSPLCHDVPFTIPDSSMKQVLTFTYITAAFIKTVGIFLTFIIFMTPNAHSIQL